jgi:tetratricopeptide (TPR) repeat protein
LSEQFAAAWEAVRGGQPGPNVESFLMAALEAEYPGLEGRLRRIATDYENRRDRQHRTCDGESHVLSAGDTPLSFTLTTPTDPGSADPPNPGATAEFVFPPGAGCPSTDPPFGETVLHDSHLPDSSKEVSCSGETVVHDGVLPPRADSDGDTLGVVGTPGQLRPAVPGYELLGELGRGGMGVVYKARQTGLNRLVALKMVLAGAHAGAQQLARFQTEAEAVAQLDHPNIVQIYEVGEHHGLPYFSLEYVPGGTLAETIAGKPCPPEQAAAVAQQLARAMAEAHQHGVIHRDLKSANVLLTRDGVPKITDFGLAKSLDSGLELTKSGTLMGTPSYMSPEQARGEMHAVGPLSDLYSLGAILYELLTGRPPFLAPSVVETLFQVRHQEPVPPRRLQPKVPKDLETICLKCLQKEPAKRYAGCHELAEDLRQFRAGEAIRARPVGRIERGWRWCRRNPRTALLTAALCGLICAVVASLVIIGVRVSREQEAVAQAREAATERIEQAAGAVASGDHRRARDLLGWSDPFLESSPALADVRDRRDTLRAQVAVYAEFKQLLDDARFDCRFGSRPEKERGRQTCGRLLALYDDIERGTGPAAAGLPPLNPEQLQLFKEDAFEAFLVAAQVEQDLAADEPARKEAARKAVVWLNRAEAVLPGTRALHVQRAACWGVLGDRDADAADIKRAEAIAPTSAVDRFWRAFAEHARGEVALRNKDAKAAPVHFRNAVAEYATFVQMRPDAFWGYFNWAFCLVRLNQLDDAAIAFTTCTRIRPDFPWPYNNRGTIHLNKKRFDQAILDYNLALAHNPRYVEAWANRGIAYAELGKTDEALSDLTRAIELNPNYAPAYAKRAEVRLARKEHAAALGDYDRLIGLTADKNPIYLQRGDAYQGMGRYEEAIQDYDRVIAADPRNPAAYYGRAGAHYARRDYLKARDDYSRVIALAPRAAGAYENRGVINWLHLKEFDAALRDWNQVIALDPKKPEPHRYIGAVHLGRREYPEALASFQKALELRPDYVQVAWARAQIYLWQGKPQQALAELDPYVSRGLPNKPETLNLRGDAYRALGDLDRAAADYRRLIELRPKEHQEVVDAYVSLALVYQKQGKLDEARACYDELVAAERNSAAAYLRRAEFRRDHRQFELALADCAAAAALDPGSVLPDLVRASIDAAAGRHREAVDRAEAALKKAPPNDGHVLYAAACVWSLAAGAAASDGPEAEAMVKEYTDRAAEFLDATLDKGFHDLSFPEHNRMTSDPALAPVRSDPRVRELLAGRP